MYKSALKNGFGSLIPDFPSYFPLTKKEFNNCMRGQTMHKLTKKELKELKRLADCKN